MEGNVFFLVIVELLIIGIIRMTILMNKLVSKLINFH